MWSERLPDAVGAVRQIAKEAFERRRAELEVADLEDRGQLQEALERLNAARVWFPSGASRPTEQRLGRALAFQRHAEGEDPDLTGILQACRDYGSSEEIVALVEEHFRRTGDFRRLVELADLEEPALPIEVAQWARWARTFRKGDLVDLAAELGREEGPAAEKFLLFLAEDPSTDRQARLLEFFRVAENRQGLSSERLASLARDIEGRLTPIIKKLQLEVNELADREQWDGWLPVAPAEAGSAGHLDSQFTALRAHLRRTLEATHELDQRLRPLLGRRIHGAVGSLRGLGEHLQREEDRLRTALEQVETLDRLRRRAVAAGEARGGWEDLREALRHIDQATVPPLLDLRRLLLEYFEGYEEVHEICQQLITVYENEGEGLSVAELAASRRRLEGELSYLTDVQPDRFHIDRLLPIPYPAFIQEVTVMVGEVEAARDHQQQVERAATQLTLLEDRLLRHQRASSPDERAAEADAIRGLLHRDLGEQTLQAVFQQKPQPRRSGHAQRLLADLEAKPWYRRLRQAVRISEGG
jgi:hypothetical protein